MPKLTRISTVLGAVLTLSVALAACGGGVPGNSIATVGSVSVTKTQFDHLMLVAAYQQASQTGATGKPVVPDPPSYAKCIAHTRSVTPAGQATSAAELKAACQLQYQGLQSSVVQALVQRAWVVGEAADENLSVSDATVTQQYDTAVRQTFGTNKRALENFFATSGQTPADIMLSIKVRTLAQKIEANVVKGRGTVSAAQVQVYYALHASQYRQPQRRNVQLILTKTAAQAQAAKRAVASGQSFAKVAQRFSIDQPSRLNGGTLLGVVRGQEIAPFDKALFAARVGALGGPVKTPFGYYVFRVQSVLPPGTQSLSQVSPAIRQILAQQRQQLAFQKWYQGFLKKWQRRTTCRPGFTLPTVCGNYRAPKAASTTIRPSTATATTGGASSNAH